MRHTGAFDDVSQADHQHGERKEHHGQHSPPDPGVCSHISFHFQP
jgi:hypothetical protein